MCDPDPDNDGLPSGADSCTRTPRGQIVHPDSGCSLLELCPCPGPRGSRISAAIRSLAARG